MRRIQTLLISVGFLFVSLGVLSFPGNARAGGMPTIQIQHDSGVLVVEPDQKSRVVLNERFGLASADGSIIVSSRISSSKRKPGAEQRSTITVVDGKSAKSQWTTTIGGTWRPEATNVDGTRVVLGDSRISPHHSDIPEGRVSTNLIILAKGESPKPVSLYGNFVAEAFSSDGSQVVLIEHVPSDHPTSYRVRPLDLRTGALLPQQGGVKSTVAASSNLEATVMQGVRLNQSWSQSGNALYTLYDASTYGPTATMFVHALNLDKVVATCLAVPEEIDAGQGHGVVTWVNDNTLAVVGRRGAATIDPRTGALITMVLLDREGQPMASAMAASLWVASGTKLEQLNVATLKSVATYVIPNDARGIVPLSYGRPVAVLDKRGSIWYAGPGVERPIKRGRVALPNAKNALLLFP